MINQWFSSPLNRAILCSTALGIPHLLTNVGIPPSREFDLNPNSTTESLILIYSSRSRLIESSFVTHCWARFGVGPMAIGQTISLIILPHHPQRSNGLKGPSKYTHHFFISTCKLKHCNLQKEEKHAKTLKTWPGSVVGEVPSFQRNNYRSIPGCRANDEGLG